MPKKLCLSIFFLLLFFYSAFGRLIQVDQLSNGSNDTDDQIGSPYIRLYVSTPSPLESSVSSSSSCEETYGFLPCTTSALGNVFLIVVYRYLMHIADKSLADGSELLLEILGPGIIGGFLLPIFRILPDALIVLASGLYGSSDTAQSQVSIGMGLLAGSNVFLLTLVWAACAFVGKCDLDGPDAIDGKDTKGINLTGSGVSTDKETSYTASIMALSVTPYLVVQIGQVFSSSGTSSAVLSGFIVSSLLLILYCIYQVLQPWIQRRRMEYAKQKQLVLGFLRHMQTRALGRLLNENGEPNQEVIEKVFRMVDRNGDGMLSEGELTAFVAGMKLRDTDFEEDDIAEKLIDEFDKHGNFHIDLNEFISGISKWSKKMEDVVDGEEAGGSKTYAANTKLYVYRAVGLLLMGSGIAVAFSEPLVDVVANFSTATGIPSFFVSFVVLPLLSSSEGAFGITFARRKTKKSISLTLSMIYGTVTMYNVLTLSVFLALVYFRELTWEFSAEVLVIFVVCLIMGGLGSLFTTLRLWTVLVAVLLYPLSLALVYILVYLCDWS